MLIACTSVITLTPLFLTQAKSKIEIATGLGLDPKNDPVVYTTQSGIDIKISNAKEFTEEITVTTNKNVSYTQNLSNFYYFTMGTYSGTFYTGETQTTTYTVNKEPVNWIILGVGSHSSNFIESVTDYLFSTIRDNNFLFENCESYFNNQYETDSPAGKLIENTISLKTYLMGKVKDSIKVNIEIPKGCMLIMTEKLLGNWYFNSKGAANSYFYSGNSQMNITQGDGEYGSRYRFIGNLDTVDAGKQTWNINGNAGGSFFNYINNLFSKNTSGTILKNGLGLSQVQADLIVPQQLYTYYNTGSAHLQENPTTDGGTFYTMFPLAYRSANTNINQNFCIEDYLKSGAQSRAVLIGYNKLHVWRLRSSHYNYHYYVHAVYPDGGVGAGGHCANSQGVRPAMVMKLK